MKDYRPRLKTNTKQMYKKWTNTDSRVLIIGDTHCPFDLDTYVDFLVDTYNRFNCNRVVHIGDEIDNHYSSYHETDANAMGGGDELAFAIERLSRYYKQFPNVDVVIGNHTRIIMRKAMTGNIPKEWIRDYNDVLKVPNWNFVTEIEIDGVLYAHGEGGTAKIKCKKDLQSLVQGHLHTQMYVEYVVGRRNRVFGMQVGCGINHESHAFGYAKAGVKPAVGCGVVIGGKEAIVVPMILENYKNGTRYGS
jgi:predicted phosphodiesterase